MVQSVLYSPVPASLACSSLGFHSAHAGLGFCEWATLDDDKRAPGRSSVTSRVLSEFECVYVSVAWELELPVLIRSLEGCGIEPHRSLRPPSDPLVVAGGPITQSNPDLMAAVCDAVFVGDADGSFAAITGCLEDSSDREEALRRLARIEGMWVPMVHGTGSAPPPVRAAREDLPTRTTITGEDNEFGGAFLVEAGRGCPRACTFCVARSGSRKTVFVPPRRILDAVPADARRVGLVGAAVSDHPRLAEVVEGLVARGAGVTLSSMRADRATPEILGLLKAGGLRTLTVAADGASDAMRDSIDKGLTSGDIERCVADATGAGIRNVRLYVMVGLPGETEEDVDELAALVSRLGGLAHLSLSVSPFVPKRFTPLADAGFAGVPVLKKRISRLKRLVGGFARVRASSPRVAEAEWRLSHAGADDAFDVMEGLGL